MQSKTTFFYIKKWLLGHEEEIDCLFRHLLTLLSDNSSISVSGGSLIHNSESKIPVCLTLLLLSQQQLDVMLIFISINSSLKFFGYHIVSTDGLLFEQHFDLVCPSILCKLIICIVGKI